MNKSEKVCRDCGWTIHLDFGVWTDSTGQSVCGFAGGEAHGHIPRAWGKVAA